CWLYVLTASDDSFIPSLVTNLFFFFFSSRRRHTRLVSDWSSDVCSSDLSLRAQSALDRAPEVVRPNERPGRVADPPAQPEGVREIGRASCRERVEISVGAVSLKKKRGKGERSRDKEARREGQCVMNVREN